MCVCGVCLYLMTDALIFSDAIIFIWSTFCPERYW